MIDAAHSRVRGEWNKLRVRHLVQLPSADSVFLFCEHDDAAPFGRFIGE